MAKKYTKFGMTKFNVIKLLLIFPVYVYVIYRIINYTEQHQFTFSKIKFDYHLILILALSVMLLLIESLKWKVIQKPVQQVSFFLSFKSVLTGMAFGIYTPYRLGDIYGKGLYTNAENKLKVMSLAVLGSIGMTFANLILFYAFFPIFIIQQDFLTPLAGSFFIATSVVITGVVFIYFPAILKRLVKGFSNAKKYIQVFEAYSIKMLLKILFLSVLKVFVYISQFIFIMSVFNAEISFLDGFIFLSTAYLIITFVPSLPTLNWGIRGLIIFALLNKVYSNELVIFGSSFLIWILNLVLPAVAGTILILLNRSKEHFKIRLGI